MHGEQYILTADDHGFHVDGREESYEVRWSDIRAITTFKRDLLTTDLICLRFRISNDEWIELHEEMTGFHEMAGLMQDHFIIPEGWQDDVMLPPFAVNHRVLWSRT